MKKQLLLFLFAIVASVGTMFASTKIGDLYYNLNETDQTAEVAGAPDEYSGAVTIPATVTYEGKYYSVTSIADNAFRGRSSLTSFNIGSGIDLIGYGAFQQNPSLTSITIPDNVTRIRELNFYQCTSLTTVTLGRGLTRLDHQVFEGCTSLNTVICYAVEPPSVNFRSFYSIDPSATLYVPAKSIEAYSSAAEWRNFANILPICSESSITGVCGAEGDNLTWELSCDGVLTISGTGEMGDDAPWLSDYKEQINAVIIADGVTSIGDRAFYGCRSLTSVTIPNSVTRIGMLAFCGCTSLTSLTIPSSVTQIDGYEFRPFIMNNNILASSTNITKLTVQAGNPVYDSRDNCNAIIETATNTLLMGCQNTIIPNSVTKIGNCAFYECTSLTSINIPESVSSIGCGAFYGTGLTNVVIPHNTTIEAPQASIYFAGAFAMCKELTSVVFADGIGEDI